jgi:AAA domain
MHRNDQLPQISQGFDVVVIDCPGRQGRIQRSALMIADRVIMPCGPGALDAWALAESIDLVKEAQELREDLEAYVLITRKQARTAVGEGAREALAEVGLPALRTELGFRVAYQEAPAAGQGVTTHDPASAAAREVRALCDELDALTKSRALHAVR